MTQGIVVRDPPPRETEGTVIYGERGGGDRAATGGLKEQRRSVAEPPGRSQQRPLEVLLGTEGGADMPGGFRGQRTRR